MSTESAPPLTINASHTTSGETTPAELANAPDLGLLDFIGNIQEQFGDAARECRYIVRINKTLDGFDGFTQNLSLLCLNAAFPGKKFATNAARYYGPEFEYPTNTIIEPFILTFLVKDDFREREFFEAWMEQINPESTFDFSYKHDYIATIDIFQYSSTGGEGWGSKPVYVKTMEECWPLSMTSQTLTWGSDNFHQLSIEFSWHIDKKSNVPQVLIPGTVNQTGLIQIA